MIEALKRFINFVFTLGTIVGAVCGTTVAVWIVYLVHFGTASQIFTPGIVNWFATSNPMWQAIFIVASPFLGCLVAGAIMGFICYVIFNKILDMLGDVIHG
jgi:Na+/phosphate symporter